MAIAFLMLAKSFKASSSRTAAVSGHEDGDVEICLSRKPEDRFVVHSVVLALNSSFFKAGLSSRWVNDNHGSAHDGKIRRRYQLRFDEGGDSTDDLNLLTRATAEAVHVAEKPGLDIDTAAIFTAYAPWIPQDNTKTSARKKIIEAHRQYLNLVHHTPLAIESSKFKYVVDSIHHLVCVADAYDSLSVVSMPVENFLIRHHRSDIKRLCNVDCKKLLNIVMKIRSGWLLKEIVCRIIGDPLWGDQDIERKFGNSDAAELLRSKRAELRDMLSHIDQRVLLLPQLPQAKKTVRVRDQRTISLATAAFRNEINHVFNSHRKDDWASYARKYRLLKQRTLSDIGWQYPRQRWFDRLYSKFGAPSKISREGFAIVFQSLQKRTAEIIQPLFDCVVKPPSVKEASCRGFLCINVTDDDLPWKEERLGESACMEKSMSSDDET